MVLPGYDEIEEYYDMIRQSACGRQACTVMVIVALEVYRLVKPTNLVPVKSRILYRWMR
jgi:hypothetical protein